MLSTCLTFSNGNSVGQSGVRITENAFVQTMENIEMGQINLFVKSFFMAFPKTYDPKIDCLINIYISLNHFFNYPTQ